MSKIFGIFALLALLALVGGGVFLATFDLPVKAERIEKVIPDDRLPR